MKTLKITLCLVAVAVLTVSGITQRDSNIDNEPTYKERSTDYKLITHKKDKLKSPTQA
jgi:hypothetical protein